jgi:hypothetical protein
MVRILRRCSRVILGLLLRRLACRDSLCLRLLLSGCTRHDSRGLRLLLLGRRPVRRHTVWRGRHRRIPASGRIGADRAAIRRCLCGVSLRGRRRRPDGIRLKPNRRGVVGRRRLVLISAAARLISGIPGLRRPDRLSIGDPGSIFDLLVGQPRMMRVLALIKPRPRSIATATACSSESSSSAPPSWGRTKAAPSRSRN